VMFILVFTVIILFSGVASITDFALQIEGLKLDTTFLIGNTIFTVIFVSLIAPLNAGFLKLCYLAKTNKEVQIGAIFDYYKSTFVKDIIMGTAIITFTTSIFSVLFSLIGYPFIGTIIQIIISLFTLLFIPLVVFGNQNFTDAIQNSIKLVAKQPFHIILLIVIAIIGCFLGLIALCIGILFTLPIFSAMIFAIYDNAVGIEEHDVISEIGVSSED
ncbi:MAG: hypothetical protein HC854_15130, partial [Flavobacterium sp.]|nr:hypothetical protein [Flavobacterium sp.]